MRSEKKVEILSSIVFNQNKLHVNFNGVVPEIAARAHCEKIDICTKEALKKASLSIKDIDLISVTSGPGLIGGLLSGVMFAKGLARGLKIPLIGVNHLAAHCFSVKIFHKINFPYLTLLVSGGHCQFLIVKNVDSFVRIGGTIDDAPGEAFDKTAKLLNLGYPGGPEIEKLAKLSQIDRFRFPRPMINSDCLNLSFSGLKTAVLYAVQKLDALSDEDKIDISNSFQNAAVDCIVSKVLKASIQENISDLVVSGGVAANEFLRCSLADAMPSNVKLHFPDLKHCTDNGLMVAHAGLMKIENSEKNYNIEARARWSLEENNDAR